MFNVIETEQFISYTTMIFQVDMKNLDEYKSPTLLVRWSWNIWLAGKIQRERVLPKEVRQGETIFLTLASTNVNLLKSNRFYLDVEYL